jgi:tetratricopeptide (TPR) repeat protein
MALRIFICLLIIILSSVTTNAQERGNIVLPFKKAQTSPLVGDSGKRKAALVVGISDYSSKNLTLKYADKDARLIFDYLQGARKFPKENIFLLADTLATSGRIYNSIHNLMKWLTAGDELILYFAGHGDVQTVADFDEAFFLAWDASDSRNYYGASGTLKLADLDNYTTRLANVKKVKVSLIMDACHAGFDLRKDGVLKAQENISSGFNQINKMLGCAVNEFSYEADSVGHGLFSWYLVQGLMGLADVPADNVVTFDELKNWTQKRVAAASKGKQNPVISSGDGTAVFAAVTPEMRADALALQKNKSYTNLLAGRGTTNEEDTIISAKLQLYIDQYNYFLSENLLYNGDSSCLAVIHSISELQNDAAIEIKNGLQNHLAEALETRSQLVLNEYLKGKSELPPASTFFNAGVEAGLADSLLDSGDPRKKNDKVMANFHKAYSYIRYENFEKYGEAEQLLREGLELENRAAYLYVTMSYLMQYQNKYDSAIYFAKKAESIIPTWSVPKNILGNLYADVYQWEKSIGYHKEVLKLDSNYVWSYNNIAISLLEMDRINEAEAYFLQSLKMKKNSGVERLNRDWAITYCNLGVIYQERGLVAKAEQYFEMADSIDNSFTVSKRKISELYASIDGEKAELLLKKAIAISPFEAENYYQLAELNRKYQLNRQSINAADSLYRKAIALNPYNEWHYAGLGYLYSDKNQHDSAIILFKKAVDISRNSADALYNLAFYYSLAGKRDSARLVYERSLAVNPYDIAIADEYASLLLEQGDTLAAEKKLTTVASLQAQSPKALYTLGNFYFKTRNFSSAAITYKQSISIDPSYTNALKALVYLQLNTGNDAGSRAYMKKLLALDSSTEILVDYINAIGEAAMKIPVTQRADWLSKFISFDPNNELLNELKAEATYLSGASLNTLFITTRAAENNLEFNSPSLIKWLFLIAVELNDDKSMKLFAQRYLDELLNTEPALYALAMKLTGNNAEAKRIKKSISRESMNYLRVNFKKLFATI